ncbi:hypothetical protein FB446DRAFT_653638 [Lentinula raphanica]|nr:hypothetical protein FB446DRAFT_653638 [Lentinula raphanica]
MAWFPDAFAYLNVDLGPEFTSLVSSWISLERTSQWRTNPKIRLPTLNRPTLLADWVDKKRYKVKANEPDVMKHCGDDFAVGVKTWWASLQPAWRQGSVGDRLSKPSPDGWKSVDKYGLNGWFGILVCLKWWGWNLQHRSKEDKAQGIRDWLDTVEDVRYLMDALTDNRRDHVVSQSA